MARKSKPKWWESRNGYYCWHQGKQERLADGPKDDPDGPNWKKACDTWADLMNGRKAPPSPGEQTFGEIANAYMAYLEGRRKARSLIRIKMMLGAMIKKHRNLPVGRVTEDVLEEVIRSMAKPRKGPRGRVLVWGPSTGRMFVAAMKACLNWAVKKKGVPLNPIRDMESRGGRVASLQRCIHDYEHEAVLRQVTTGRTQPLRRLILALDNTGARPGELINARVRNFDPKDGVIRHMPDDRKHPDDYSHKTAGKGNIRTILLTGKVLEMVKELVKGKRPDEHIFLNSHGKPYTTMGLVQCFSRLRERTGFKHLVPYTYRHRFATRWLKGGGSAERLAVLMGNTLKTIMVYYSHHFRQPMELRETLEAIQANTPL